MGLIVLEALIALAILVLFVWWTMRPGRGDRSERDHTENSGD